MTNAFRLRIDNEIGILTFDLPGEKVNKLSSPVLAELDRLLDQLSESIHVSALIIESAKPGVFIAGADINEIKELKDPYQTTDLLNKAHGILKKLEDLPFPTIAAINGACLGGGLELALACTARVASDSNKTQIGLPEVNLGIIPGFGGTQRLPRVAGLQNSLGIILTGKPLDGKKAWKQHVVDAYFSEAFFMPSVLKFTKELMTESGLRKLKKSRELKGVLPLLLEKNPVGRYVVFNKAKANILKETKGHYPAPLAALKAVKLGWGKPLSRALSIEASCLCEVAHTQVSKNLIHLFFLSELLKKDPGFLPDSPVNAKPIHDAAVLGAGLMGGGIAWTLTHQNISVRMKDITWDAIAKGYESAQKIYDQLLKKKKAQPNEVANGINRISGTLTYQGFKRVDIVIEAILEKMDLKKSVFKEMEKHVQPDTILASNTSALSITEMASDLVNPERFIGMHFFSPVNRMPLVEIIPGQKTSPETVATIVELARTMKKTPIVVKNCPGFLVNRILLPYVNEAVLCLQDGDDITHIDKVAEEFGMPLGPLSLADEVGLDVGIKVSQTLEEGYGERMKVAALFTDVLADQLLRGKKTGQGFYVHSGKDKAVNPAMLRLIQKNASSIKGSPNDTLNRLILVMINEAARCMEEQVVSSAGHLDMAMIMGTGFPPFRGGLLKYADQQGLPTIVNQLELLARLYGDRFKPAALLVTLAHHEKTFY